MPPFGTQSLSFPPPVPVPVQNMASSSSHPILLYSSTKQNYKIIKKRSPWQGKVEEGSVTHFIKDLYTVKLQLLGLKFAEIEFLLF